MIRSSKNIASSFSEKTKNSPVSNKNIILYYYHLKNDPLCNKRRIDPAELLFENKAEEEFFLDKEQWCRLEDYVNIVENAIRFTNNPELPRIVGSLLIKYQKECRLQDLKDALSQSLKAFLKGPTAVFKDISFYNSLFNQTKDMEFISGKNGECLIKTEFRPDIDPIFDYISEPYILGMFDSILDLFDIKEGGVENTIKEYDLKNLLEKKFYKKGAVQERKNILFLNNRPVAEKIEPTKEKDGVFLKLNKNRAFSGTGKVYRIIKDVYWEKQYRILKRGEIYNAPFFLTRISWKKTPYLKNTAYVLRTKVNKNSPMGENYSRLVQKRIQEEQKEAKLRAERQAIEEEYNQLLLENYIHPYFINKAKSGPIPFKNIIVTNIFLDIRNSTRIRNKIGDEEFRKNRNFLLYLIKTTLREKAGEWGWINKVMGDGCYIVTGTYNYFKSKEDQRHVLEAFNFVNELIKKIESHKKANTPSPNLKHYFLRFGIEAGEVEMGEILEQKPHEKGAPPGNLRIFDVDGVSANLAKRIEENSKYILDQKNNRKGHGVFAGPEIIDRFQGLLLNDRIEYINLRDYNLTIKGFEEIRTIGEIKFNNNEI